MKKITFWFTIFIGLIFGYSLVLADLGNSPQLKLEHSFKSGDNIFLDSKNLNSIIISYESNIDLSKYSLYSVCDSKSQFLDSSRSQYFFKFKYKDKSCSNPNIVLKDDLGNVIVDSLIKVRLIKNTDLYNVFLDYSDKDLKVLYKKVYENVKKYSIFSNYEKNNSKKVLSFLKKSRIYKEYLYSLAIIENIINNRKQKYILPVKGYKLSNLNSKLPNANRGYRKEYTDGIHHGWDIDAPYGTEVVALDDGVIIRIVDGFKSSELNNIKRGKSLTYLEELHNLDILRGNQVWLKTMKGELIFYSHLSEVSQNLKEGKMVKKGENLGKIGITGIPGKNYTDYHLHFVIHENPYYKNKAGKYSFDDYMSWDWKFKGEKVDYIKENSYTIFE
ncbi:hypothetical protein CSB07_01535 [Candidatus Gracilibacteria bacterium]|nr:MAG: hypothetical protein CSB07_01535 [Candidatus Gracilibacteria bacterium]PIE85038.1 MAG: hypothetical protein CSA08_03805 [Candidatus Gracilibacteria bacterium]